MRPGGPGWDQGPGWGPGPGWGAGPGPWGPGPGGGGWGQGPGPWDWGPGPGAGWGWGGGPGGGFFGGFTDGLCSMISSVFYCLCCCWLVQDCFGGPRGPGPYAPPGRPPFF